MSPLRAEVGPRPAGFTTRAVAGPAFRPVAVGVAAMMLAGAAGAALAADVRAGAGLVLLVLYVPVALTNLPLAIALWVPTTFLQALPAFNLGTEAAGALLAVAWLGTIRATGTARAVAVVIHQNRRTFMALALLLVWLSLSLLWARNPSRVLDDLWHWFALAGLLLVLSTTLRTRRAVQLVFAGFVVGALASILYGLVFSNSLTAPGLASARLQGAGGDPNALAASLVAGVVLAGALAVSSQRPWVRVAPVAAIPALVAGLVASQSRGGGIAALLTVLVAFVVFERGRVHVAAFTLLAVGAAMMWFSTTPGAWQRLTNFDAGGGGRSTLWTGAWRVTKDHPVGGVALNNFRDVAPDYARQPGQLEDVHILAEQPRFVHNTYLQLLAENGVIGLLLYLGFTLGCLRAMLVAARRFKAMRNTSLETLARAAFVATISMLIAAFFLSAAIDARMWILFALGPALLGIASRVPEGSSAVEVR
jgi:O-antigen ligase